MTIYYVDLYNGNDAALGTSWGAAWKTMSNGPTAARIAAGDEIRISKTPDPTQVFASGVQWTFDSSFIILPSSVTYLLDACEAPWTAVSPNTSQNYLTLYKLGTKSLGTFIDSSFTTGRAFYKDLGLTIDLSAYRQVSFWMRLNSVATLPSSGLSFVFCSDASGTVPLTKCYLPNCPIISTWAPYVLDNGSGLPSNVRSIALYIESDFGGGDINWDNFIACKASSAPDSLTLTSLISKNGTPQGNEDGWYPIQSISGTTIILDSHTGYIPFSNTYYKYGGTTATTTLYKREAFKLPMPVTQTGFWAGTVKNGGYASYINYEFGYDPVTNTQNGETIFDCQNGFSTFGCSYAYAYNSLNWFGAVRSYYGLYSDGATGLRVKNLGTIAGCTYGVLFTANESQFDNISSITNCIYGCRIGGYNSQLIKLLKTRGSNVGLLSNAGSLKVNQYMSINESIPLQLSGGSTVIDKSKIHSGGTISCTSNNSIINDLEYSDSPITITIPTGTRGRLTVGRVNKNDNDIRIYGDNFQITAETGIVRTPNSYSWKISPVSIDSLTEDEPANLPIAKVFCRGGEQRIIRAYINRSNTGLNMRLAIPNLKNKIQRSSNFWYQDYPYRKKIEISNVNITENLSGFPLFVRIANDTHLAANTHISGYDLRFTSSDGVTPINHEIELYRTNDGMADARLWVNVPTISSGNPTNIYMYYGKPTVTSSYANPTGVWDNNYVFVFHFANNLDSKVGIVGSGSNVSYVENKRGPNLRLNTNTGVIELPYLTHSIGSGPFTMSAWAYANKAIASGTWAMIFGNQGYSPGLYIKNTGYYNDVQLYWSTEKTSGMAMKLHEWTHVSAVRATGLVTYFINGIEGTLHPASVESMANGIIKIGQQSTLGSEPWYGELDEVRFQRTARSRAWNKFEYHNMASAANELTITNESAPTIYTDAKGSAGTWELLELPFTTSEDGVVEAEILAWGGLSYNGYVDDVSIL